MILAFVNVVCRLSMLVLPTAGIMGYCNKRYINTQRLCSKVRMTMIELINLSLFSHHES